MVRKITQLISATPKALNWARLRAIEKDIFDPEFSVRSDSTMELTTKPSWSALHVNQPKLHGSTLKKIALSTANI